MILGPPYKMTMQTVFYVWFKPELQLLVFLSLVLRYSGWGQMMNNLMFHPFVTGSISVIFPRDTSNVG